MNDHLDHICGGRWQPMLGWPGRYRCDKCRVMGYRSMVRSHGSHIVQYLCSRRCRHGAVQGSPTRRKAKGPLLCKEHAV